MSFETVISVTLHWYAKPKKPQIRGFETADRGSVTGGGRAKKGGEPFSGAARRGRYLAKKKNQELNFCGF